MGNAANHYHLGVHVACGLM